MATETQMREAELRLDRFFAERELAIRNPITAANASDRATAVTAAADELTAIAALLS